MMRTFLKLLLCIVVYTVVYSTINVILPFSQGLKELGSSENPIDILFTLIYISWVCLTMFFIVRHSNLGGKKLFVNIVIIMFFIISFLTQIETLLFGNAFPVLTIFDVTLLMLSVLFSMTSTALLIVFFFQNKNSTAEKWNINIKNLLIRLLIIGILYYCLYAIFGFFVAWQFEELRLFYTGSAVNNIIESGPVIKMPDQRIYIPIQVVRGILFGLFVIPLRKMISSRTKFITSVCLMYLCTAFQLIIPNKLFPDIVRIAHLIEMTGSMLLFGIIVGNILWGKRVKLTGQPHQ